MITLKYTGLSRRGGLGEGMYLNVPTNWATARDHVTKDAIPEIMEALEEKHIVISPKDYDHVFYTCAVEKWEWETPLINPGRRAGKVLMYWDKV